MADFNTALLLPMIVQTLLICALAFIMGGSRFVAAKTRKVDLRDVAKTGKWPGKLGVLSDSYDNQFQMPQLFYIACIALTLLGAVTAMAIKLAWAFVALRFIHMIWHNTANIVIVRFLIFVGSGITVTWMLILAFQAAL